MMRIFIAFWDHPKLASGCTYGLMQSLTQTYPHDMLLVADVPC